MFRRLLSKKESGFTIIEVMIVLAIAGLILVVVLVAVPQLQRNQRDTARQDVAGRLSTELGTYATNNGGVYPFGTAATGSGTLADFNARYVNGGAALDLKNPKTGSQYTVQLETVITADPGPDAISIYPGASCSGEVVAGSISNTSRQFALRVALERTGTFYCVDNI